MANKGGRFYKDKDKSGNTTQSKPKPESDDSKKDTKGDK